MNYCTNCSVKFSDYFQDELYTWCTNCGNYGIAAAEKRALAAEDIEPKDAVLCFDIGCHGNGADKIGGYRFHGLHGRVIPVASGIAIANRNLKVVAHAGDGGTLSEGVNHLVHAIRNNYNITFILHNNSNYGLTKGQASATTRKEVPMNSSPDGVTAEPIHVLNLVFSLKPTFVARGFSGNVPQLTGIIQAGLQHRGFSFIEVLQACPAYNKETPHEWYQERVQDVNTVDGYDNTDLFKAIEISQDIDNKIATGVIYKDPERMSFYENQQNRREFHNNLTEEVTSQDISKFLHFYK